MAKNNEIKFKFDGNQINYEIGDIDADNAMRATAILLITIMMQTGITVPNHSGNAEKRTAGNDDGHDVRQQK